MTRTIVSAVILQVVMAILFCTTSDSLNTKKELKKMVTTQIKRRGIKDKKVLEAMLRVDRKLFIPKKYKRSAYDDNPLPIGEGQTISQPYIVALMTEVLNLDNTKRVLEVGTGSGYQAAILGEICQEVYTIEIIRTLGVRAQKLLESLGYTNINVRIGDGYKGWSEQAPFDGIIVTCAPSHIPKPLIDQLAEGGIMVIPVDVERGGQDLQVLSKIKGTMKKERVIPVRFVPMTKEDGSEY